MLATGGGADSAGATFTIDSGLKDLRTMAAEGKARGMDLPLVERAADASKKRAAAAGASATAPPSRSTGRARKK